MAAQVLYEAAVPRNVAAAGAKALPMGAGAETGERLVLTGRMRKGAAAAIAAAVAGAAAAEQHGLGAMRMQSSGARVLGCQEQVPER